MTQLTPIRGFTNTPVTKVVCIVSTILPLVLSILSIKYVVYLIIDPYLSEYLQVWRVLTYQLSVVNESDYLLAALLWFQFKVLERFYGSRKYLSIVVLFAVYNAIACVLFMLVGQLVVNYLAFAIKLLISNFQGEMAYGKTMFNEVIPGPVGILSSLYVSYTVNIPVCYYFKILLRKPATNAEDENVGEKASSKELTLSNQFPIHIIYTMLLLNNGIRSIIPGVVGLLIGKLHSYDLLPGGSSWLIPRFVFQLSVNPRRTLTSAVHYLHQRVFSRGYESVPNGQFAERAELRINSEEPDDNDEILDETRQQESQIRAETPVRPLGSQFLDTFRT
ncbi:uncharacterized protein LODBEIA_P33140 [Lodderomyces beijingensis]|uniref:Derlin n=1 Tax=Lodderomyces beijingensis TaxID=1775926 RepID=A0ABP0ZSA1_9ASCO